MKLLVVTPTFFPQVGGAEKGIHEIYDRLGVRHQVEILAPALRNSEFTGSQSVSQHYRVHRFGTASRDLPTPLRRGSTGTGLSILSTLMNVHRRLRPDAVNLHFIAPHAPHLITYSKLTGTPLVLSLVGRGDVYARLGRAARLTAAQALSRADRIIPNSDYYLRGTSIPEDRITKIPYGVNIMDFRLPNQPMLPRNKLGFPDDAFILLTVSRLAKVKKIDDLLNALKVALVRAPNLRLVIVGKGEEEAALRRLTRSLGLADHVHFAGFVSADELPAYYALADLFVFASQFETFGVVFAEAMAAGLPILATRTSCVPDIVSHEINGIIVEPDDPNAIACALLSLISQPATLKRMGERNSQRAKREFDWAVIAESYEDVFTELLSNRRQVPSLLHDRRRLGRRSQAG